MGDAAISLVVQGKHTPTTRGGGYKSKRSPKPEPSLTEGPTSRPTAGNG